MSNPDYQPPVLNLELVESRIDLPPGPPRRQAAHITPPPLYTLHPNQYQDFQTIPLADAAITEAAPCTLRKETILITFLLLMASISFAGALVMCVMLSLSNYSSLRGPFPVLIFAMAAFLVLAGGLIAKVVCLCMRRRKRNSSGGGVEVEVVEKVVAPPGYMAGLEGRDPLAGLGKDPLAGLGRDTMGKKGAGK